MKSVATLDPGTCAELAELLKAQQIDCEVRTATDENGLERSDVMVEDRSFDLACDVVEQWQDARQKEIEKRTHRRCPKCNSAHLEPVEDAHYQDVGLTVLRCLDCENLIPLGG